MTPAQITPVIRYELRQLSPGAKSSLMALLRSRLMMLVGTNNLEASDARLPALAQHFARQRNRAAEIAIADFEELFGLETERDHNNHLGAVSDTDSCERIGGESQSGHDIWERKSSLRRSE